MSHHQMGKLGVFHHSTALHLCVGPGILGGSTILKGWEYMGAQTLVPLRQDFSRYVVRECS